MASLCHVHQWTPEVFVHAAYALAERMEGLRLAMVGGRAEEDLAEEVLWDSLMATAADLGEDLRDLARLLDEKGAEAFTTPRGREG